MKLSFVTANLGSGGAERVISLLANEFDKHGYQVEIIFLKERRVFYPVNPLVNLVIADEECLSSNMLKKMWWFRRYIKRTKPDVVVPFRVSVYCTTILSLLGISVPIVASERIDPHVPDFFWTYLRKLLLPFVSHLVVQTSYIKSYYPKHIQKKTSVILNPVREEVFENPIKDSRVQGSIGKGVASYDLSGHNFCHNSSKQTSLTDLVAPKVQLSKLNRIISVARLDPQKNQQMMIRAFAKIANEFPDWQLVIFGEGPLRSSLELIVKSLQLEGRVLLPGRTEHVIDELRKSKVFCFSSDYEGLSNSMIEALCVGLPIVTTNVSGTEDIIVDGENGFVVPIKDEDAMMQSLRVLIADEQLMREMGERNRQKAHIFSIDGIYAQWEKIIQSVVRDGN